MSEKTYCEYCHSLTVDDRLGHCAACGAPRSKEADIGELTAELYRMLYGKPVLVHNGVTIFATT